MRTRRQAFGQHFLHHKPTIKKIIDLVEQVIDSSKKPTQALLEIGPGKLALTERLQEVSQNKKIPLVLVERDLKLEPHLQNNLNDSVSLHFMDAATEKLPALIEELDKQKQTPVFVASNLPYSASSQILANLCHQSHRLSGCVVMVQKELAARMAARAGASARGSFSLLIQSYFEVITAFDVGAGAFTPPPKVVSTVVILKPLPKPLIATLESPLKFERFCKKLFSQRRKMIRSLIPKEKHDLFPKFDISGTERPETLKLETIIELYRRCEEGI